MSMWSMTNTSWASEWSTGLELRENKETRRKNERTGLPLLNAKVCSKNNPRVIAAELTKTLQINVSTKTFQNKLKWNQLCNERLNAADAIRPWNMVKHLEFARKKCNLDKGSVGVSEFYTRKKMKPGWKWWQHVCLGWKPLQVLSVWFPVPVSVSYDLGSNICRKRFSDCAGWRKI